MAQTILYGIIYWPQGPMLVTNEKGKVVLFTNNTYAESYSKDDVGNPWMCTIIEVPMKALSSMSFTIVE